MCSSQNSTFYYLQEYLIKLQAIRLQNYQERKRIQQRMILYQAPPSSKPKEEVGKPKVDKSGEDRLEAEKLNAPAAIPPPTSPPPQLDPEERRRKIAALKVHVM